MLWRYNCEIPHGKGYCFCLAVSFLFHAVVFSPLLFLASAGMFATSEPHVMYVSLVSQKNTTAVRKETTLIPTPSPVKLAVAPVKERPKIAHVTTVVKTATALTNGTQKHIDWSTIQADLDSMSTAGSYVRTGSMSGSAQIESLKNAYIRDCRQKIEQTGNSNDHAKSDGRVIVHVAITPDGKVSEVYAENSDETNEELQTTAIEIIKNSAPFAEFPMSLAMETSIVRFTVPINFVSQK